MLLDVIFTYLPLILSLYNFRGLTKINVYHSNQIIRIVLCFLVSNILKIYFGIERPVIIERGYIRGSIDKLTYMFTSNYAFPSTHSVFYTQYFMYNMSLPSFVMCITGIFTRVFYDHHTFTQMFLGLYFVLLMKLIVFNKFKIKRKCVIESNWIRYKIRQNKEYNGSIKL